MKRRFCTNGEAAWGLRDEVIDLACGPPSPRFTAGVVGRFWRNGWRPASIDARFTAEPWLDSDATIFRNLEGTLARDDRGMPVRR
jgi:hypothetical protein